MKIGGSTAWRSITQPISDRSLTDALAGLRHVELANECLSAIPAERDGHQSHGLPAPARDIHRASSPCPQASQRQIALRSEGNLTSPSKRICPTPTWNGVRLARCFARRDPSATDTGFCPPTSTPVASRGLPAPARDIHRASEYALHPPGTAFGLLGVLLEGSYGNRYRRPSPSTVPQLVSIRHQIDLRPVFGTATLPTDAPVASSCGEEGFYRHFGTGTLY